MQFGLICFYSRRSTSIGSSSLTSIHLPTEEKQFVRPDTLREEKEESEEEAPERGTFTKSPRPMSPTAEVLLPIIHIGTHSLKKINVFERF